MRKTENKKLYISPAAEPLTCSGTDIICTSNELTTENYIDKEITW